MSLVQARPRIATQFLWATAALVILGGCSSGGHGPTAPGAASLAPSASLGALQGGTVLSDELGMAESVPGGWTLDLTTEPLTATLTPWRHNAGLQGNLFDLDIENFLKPNTLSINGVRFDPDGNVIVDYVVAHPFAAPNFANPITAANRADLSVTGRVLFLTDVLAADLPNRRFFNNTVVANTDAVLNANNYVDPGDLLATSLAGFSATVFPSRLMVDEARGGGQGNRIGVPNGGTPTGNYNAGAGGWQRSNIGTSNTGWTGYDYLHGGQRASNSVVFSQAAVAAGSASLDVALLVKYSDPRGVPFFQNPNVRMPQNPADINIFAYRLPNAAIDASDIQFQSLTGKTLNVGATAGSDAPLTIRVRDWDARATETTETMLQMDPDISKVNIGTSGAPVVTLSAPALATGDFTFTAGAQSGLPGAEIQYTGTVTNSRGTAPEGSRQVGLVRVVDPENSAPGRNTYHFGVDPVTVTADPARALDVITYQSLFFNIPDGNTAPSCGGLEINGPGTIGVGGAFTVNLAAATDAQMDTLTIGMSYSGPTNSSTSNIMLTDAQRAGEGMFNPFTDVRLTSKLQPPTVPGNYTLTVTLDDGSAAPVQCTDTFTVMANTAPSCGTTAINETGPFAAPAQFTLNLSSIADTDSANLVLRFSYTGPSSDITSDLAIATSALSAETMFNPFTDPRLTFPLVRPTLAGDYQLLIEIDDGSAGTSCGPYDFTVTGVANEAPDCGTFASQFPKSIAPGATFTLDLTTITDAENDSLTFGFSYAGPAMGTSGSITLSGVQRASETAFNPFTDGRLAPALMPTAVTGDYTFTITLDDGTNDVVCGPYDFTVEGTPNMPPTCGTTGINGSGTIPSGGDFTVDLSDINDPDTADLTFAFRYTGPDTDMSGTMELAVADLGAEDEFNPFTDVRLSDTLGNPVTPGAYEFFVMLDDGDNQVSCGPFAFTVEGMTGPPDCNAGISLSESLFSEGETVDFTVDLSAITDPDSLEAMVTISYTGPESSTTNEVTAPYPLPAAINPFTNPGFSTNLDRPTTVGLYTLTATVRDMEKNTTECMTTFTIAPVGAVSAVTDIDVEINFTDSPDTDGRTIDTTDTLTITWAEDDAPEYAIYADLNPRLDDYDPVTYRPNTPEVDDNLVLIGTSATNSFTGFEIPPLEGILTAYIVVRARETAGSAGSETADSEPAFVGIMADIAATGAGVIDPIWAYQANPAGNPVRFLNLNIDPGALRGNALGFDNVTPGGVAGIAGINLPVTMDANVDRAYFTGNFFNGGWDTLEGQGEVGLNLEPGFSALNWLPLAMGAPYNVESADIETWLDGVPTGESNVHEDADGLGTWHFFRYEGISLLGMGTVSSMGYTFGNLAFTVCGAECPAWDEVGWVYD